MRRASEQARIYVVGQASGQARIYVARPGIRANLDIPEQTSRGCGRLGRPEKVTSWDSRTKSFYGTTPKDLRDSACRLSAQVHHQWPTHAAHALGLAPCRLQFQRMHCYRIDASGIPAARCGRQAAQVSKQLRQGPFGGQPRLRCRQRFERPSVLRIAGIDFGTLWRPIRSNFVTEGVGRRRQIVGEQHVLVSPSGQHAASAQDPIALTEESRLVEPVQRLRDDHQIDACRAKRSGLCRFDSDLHVLCLLLPCPVPLHLLGARIGGEDMSESRRQVSCRLTATAARLPHLRLCWHVRRKRIEQRCRRAGAPAGVSASDRGEVILERDRAHDAGGADCSSRRWSSPTMRDSTNLSWARCDMSAMSSPASSGRDLSPSRIGAT